MSEEDKIVEVITFGIPANLARNALEMYHWDVGSVVNAYYEGNLDISPSRNNSQNTVRIPLQGNDYQIQRAFLDRARDFNRRRPDFDNDPDFRVPRAEEVFEMELEIPSLLGLPNNEEEYNSRFLEYEKEKEDRKTDFLKRSVAGYHIAREKYYEAVRHIFFVTKGYDSIKRVVSLYSKYNHIANLKKLIIVLRKIAECDYILGLFDEAIEMFEVIKLVHDLCLINAKRILNRREVDIQKEVSAPMMMKLSFAVMGKIMIEKEDLEKANEYIGFGLQIDPSSGVLRKAEEFLQRKLKGEDVMSEREVVWRVSEDFPRCKIYPIRLKKFLVGLDGHNVFDDLLRERVAFMQSTDVIKTIWKDLSSELVIDVKVNGRRGNFDVALWKSFI